MSRAPDDEGNEHQVWFQPETDTYLKVTWPYFFGMLVIYRQDEEEQASPIAYLERWHLHNELFGDRVRFLGALEADGRLRLIIQQQAIEGEPATLEQINDFFTGNGWRRFMANGEVVKGTGCIWFLRCGGPSRNSRCAFIAFTFITSGKPHLPRLSSRSPSKKPGIKTLSDKPRLLFQSVLFRLYET